MSVIHNTSKPESTLKKCNAIVYDAICEAVVMKETLTGHIRLEDISAVLLTKMVMGQKRNYMTYIMRIPNN